VNVRYVKVISVVSLMAFGLLATTNVASAATPSSGNTYNCTGGNVKSGTYGSIVITGVCYMRRGTVVVQGDLVVAPGALLDAVTPGDPGSHPLVPATVLVGGSVFVGAGAVLLLGCSPNISCPTGVTYDRIGGSLTAFGALAVVVHSTAIGGSLSMFGGGGGTDTCTSIPPLWLEDPALANGEGPGHPIPVYSDAEDNSVGGNLSFTGLQSCWLGSLRNEVSGSAIFIGNSMGDPDALEINNNLISGSMVCFGNQPAVQYGDGGSAPNMVGGFGIGECGFNVVVPNPAPEAGEGPGVPEHIAVSTWSLATYSGTHTQTSGKSFVFGKTKSHDKIIGEKNKVVLAGSGLTGAVKEKVLVTAFPGGNQSFTAVDKCTCSFDGQSGTVSLRAYGTTSSTGVTSGTFLVTSGGTGSGGLATLAGYGTFSNAGQPAGTLSLVEHLRIT
jgi:hypothetical protein